MKKKVLAVMIAAMAVLSGCGGEGEDSSSPIVDLTPVELATEEPAAEPDESEPAESEPEAEPEESRLMRNCRTRDLLRLWWIMRKLRCLITG